MQLNSLPLKCPVPALRSLTTHCSGRPALHVLCSHKARAARSAAERGRWADYGEYEIAHSAHEMRGHSIGRSETGPRKVSDIAR